GSARLGQSLTPARLGAPFSDKSDLDFATVSSSLFDRLTGDFNSWANDYEDTRITPGNASEEIYWRDNLKRGPQIIGRGFIDSKMIPLKASYATARLVADTMYVLTEKLMVTANAPRIRYASIRAYRDWGCFARQFTR